MANAPAATIVDTDLDQKMRESYLDYAMSVIVSRALPDVRDGLKPVQRRVLYTMHELSLRADAPYKKSARIVGDVLGKYHPHGDTAVYEALVRMAQDFNVRYPLVDGQGNFGSVDGDGAAAMRYTEVRLTALAEEMLADLDKNTVAFGDNFDGSLREPLVLPGKVPMFLLNGAEGIAVGMAASVPPHNLRELCEAIVLLTADADTPIERLIEALPGPDFPTGGIIVGREGIDRAYATGSGKVTLRGVASIEGDGRGRQTVAITELPYQVKKAKLIENIAEQVRDKKIEGIAAMRDESDREGMRIAIEIRRDADAATVLRALYKRTDLQVTFGINMLGLVDAAPHQLSLKRSLNLFIEHRKAVITARTQYDLDQASDRLHILEGLNKALGSLDLVIAIIRGAASSDAAQKALCEQLELTPAQARAILEMRLARLAALERKKIVDELKEVQRTVRELQGILASPKRIVKILVDDLRDLQARFGDERRTRIIDNAADVPLSIEDLVPNQETVVALMDDGTIKRLDQFGGRASARETPLQYLPCNVRDLLLLFTARGAYHGVPVHRVAAVARRSERGAAVASLVELQPGDRVVAMLTAGSDLPPYLAFLTARGQVKRSVATEYLSARAAPVAAMRLDEGDELIAVEPCPEGAELLLHTEAGRALRFPADEVRATGRAAGGVRGLRTEDGDRALAGTLVAHGPAIAVLTRNGTGKRIPIADYPLQGRDGAGVRVFRLNPLTGPLAVARCLDERASLEGVDGEGRAIVLEAKEIPLQAREKAGTQVVEGVTSAVVLPRR